MSATVKTVYAPGGNYLFTSAIGALPAGVRLQGTWAQAPRHLGYRYSNAVKPMAGKGSTLVVVANEGTATGSFLTTTDGAHISGFSFFYPAQVKSLAAPKVYPWTVVLTGSNPAVTHCEFVNPYQAVYMHVGQGHKVEDLFGQPLQTGLYASQLLDTSWVDRVNWFPGYTYLSTEEPAGSNTPTPLGAYVNGNSSVAAFKLGRVDNLQMAGICSYGYHTVLKTVTDPSEVTTYAGGSGRRGRPWAHVNGFLADGCVHGIDILDTAAPGNSGQGLTITGGAIYVGPYANITLSANLYGVITDSTFSGYLRVSNLSVGGAPPLSGCRSSARRPRSS